MIMKATISTKKSFVSVFFALPAIAIEKEERNGMRNVTYSFGFRHKIWDVTVSRPMPRIATT